MYGSILPPPRVRVQFSLLTEPRTLGRRTNALCPLSKSQSLGKEGILDMTRENAPFQQHAWGYFALRRLLRCSKERILPLVENICDLMGFGRVDKVRTADCFLCSLSLLVQSLLRVMKG